MGKPLLRIQSINTSLQRIEFARIQGSERKKETTYTRVASFEVRSQIQHSGKRKFCNSSEYSRALPEMESFVYLGVCSKNPTKIK